MNALTKSSHIYISAGEASGDLLGAELAKAILTKNSHIKLTGMGGVQMAQAGVKILFDAHKLSVVGVTEVFANLFTILSTLHQIKKYFKREKPDLIIFIDFPDSHLRLAKTAKKLGIPVLYYVSPQIWAWRASRIKLIKKVVDHMAVLFPFEMPLYEKAGIPVSFVGHPLKKTVKPSMSKEVAYRFFQLDSNKPIVTLLPGSRTGEVKRHLNLFIAASKKIHDTMPGAQFLLPVAAHLDEKALQKDLPSHIRTTKHHLYDLLQISNAAICVSGTVTLEVALMQVPLCITYCLNPINFWIIKQLAKVNMIGLCNIVAQEKIAKEFIQHEATADNIANEIIRLLQDQTHHERMQEKLASVKAILGPTNGSEQVAQLALNLIQ